MLGHTNGLFKSNLPEKLAVVGLICPNLVEILACTDLTPILDVCVTPEGNLNSNGISKIVGWNYRIDLR